MITLDVSGMDDETRNSINAAVQSVYEGYLLVIQLYSLWIGMQLVASVIVIQVPIRTLENSSIFVDL